MCDFERYNIKVVEGNEFTLLLPLKSRTFVASRPVDEDIVIEDLENLRVFVNNTEYSSVRQESDGVAIDFPATLKQGDYDVILTATYHGVDIRAAYNDAVIIVAWNQQSDAQQYVQGSPFVLPAAYVSGVMTDSELEALKAQLRLEIAAAQRAKEEADAAKEEYIAKAEALDDVAQQSTLTQGVQDIREDISHIDIDTSNLAKQGSNAGATLTDTQAAATQAASDAAAAKTAAQQAQQAAASSAQESTSQEILMKVNAIVNSHIYTGVSLEGYTFTAGFTPGIGDILFNMKNLTIIYDDKVASITKYIIFDNTCQLQSITMTNVEEISFGGLYMFSQAPTSEINFPKLKKLGVDQWIRGGSQNLTSISLPELFTIAVQRVFYYCQYLRNIEMPKLEVISGSVTTANLFEGCSRLENVTMGQNVSVSFSLASWNPTAISSDTDAVARILANIRNNIAANLPDRTGLSALTITLSSTIKTMITNESGGATAAAFSNKNWTIA